MASAYSITTYRDPEKVDLSSTFKAQAYKQQNYDQNVTQVQQLVNQYAGTDLLRDVDKDYFAERLNTIVKYVNESGTSDWSRKSVANEIQNYVSNAIDQNVVTAIGSTRAYRNQMAKIDTIKEKNPELWSLQNQEFATQDLNRYLSSGKVGDSYKARDYVNYKDVQKHILDNAKTLKEFGVEYHTDPIGGNSYFTRMGKSERISNESAREYLNMIMTPEMQNQLSIDGWYTYRNTKDEDIVEKYQTRLNSNLDYVTDRKSKLKLELLSAPANKKAEIQANIDSLIAYESNINDQKNNPKIGRDGMINNLYINDFYDKNTSFLSYDRVIDTFVDNSGFQIAEFTQKVNNDNFRNQMDANKFNYQIGQDQIKNSMDREKLDLEYKKIGYKANGDGTYSLDPNSSFGPGGLPITDIVSEQGKKEIPDGFLALDKEHSANAAAMNDIVTPEVDKILQDPKNENLAKELGISKSTTAQGFAWMMVNSPSKAKVLYNLMSDEAKTLIDKTRGTTTSLNSVDDHYKAVRTNAQVFVKGIENSPKESSKKLFDIANNGFIIDTSGKVVRGEIANSNRKDSFANTTKMVGYYNSILSSENLSEPDKAKYHRLILNEIKNTTGADGKKIDINTAAGIFDKMVYRPSTGGIIDTLGKGIAAGPLGSFTQFLIKSTQNTVNWAGDTQGDTLGADALGEYRDKLLNGKYNSRGLLSDVGQGILNKVRQNEDVMSIGDSDIKLPNGMSMSKLNEDNKQQLEAISKKLTNYKYDVSKAVNLYMGDKKTQAMLPHIMSVLPIGTDIQKDSNLQMVIDQKTGLATITASVKDGKEYKVETFNDINMSNLPPQILQNIKFENDNKIYSASNPYAVKYSNDVEIPQNQEAFAKKIEFLPEKDRYKAWEDYNNNPLSTQEGIINQMKTVYGEELITKNAEAISKIISTPVNITTEPINNKWSIVGRQDGNIVYMSPPTDEIYDRNLISQQSEKLVSEIIQENVKKVIKNGRK